MNTPAAALSHLRRQRPEWQPWLAVVEEIVQELQTPAWAECVPRDGRRERRGIPCLDGAALTVPDTVVRRLFDRLLRTASRGSTPQLVTVAHAVNRTPDVLGLFVAALCHDGDRLAEHAGVASADPGAFQAIAALLPVPFLQACHRQFASAIPEDWVEPYCPICGSWPAFTEVLGIERARHYRCGRCGAAWHAHGLSCPYCRTIDHEQLLTLVPEKAGSSAVIDACRQCRGYLKTFNRLQGCEAGAVMIEDLGSVALDVAALEDGYKRPPGSGYRLRVTVSNGKCRADYSHGTHENDQRSRAPDSTC